MKQRMKDKYGELEGKKQENPSEGATNFTYKEIMELNI